MAESSPDSPAAQAPTTESSLFQAHPRPDRVPLLVAFSSIGSKAFHFYRLTQRLHCSRLFIRDPHLTKWYQHGLTPEGKLDDIADLIREHLRPGQALYCIGSSMGGYAAIYFGLKLGARRVLAISPQIVLLPGLPRSPRATRIQVDTLAPLLDQPHETEVNLLFGGNDLVDLFQAFSFNPHAPRVVATSLIGGGHHLSPRLNEGDRLKHRFSELIQQKPLDFSLYPTQSIGEYHPLQVDLTRQVVPLYYAGKDDAAVECLLPALEKFPDWALAQSWLGQAALRSPRYRHLAATAVATSVRLEPGFPDFNYEAARISLELGDAAACRLYLAQLLALDPAHLHGLRLAQKIDLALPSPTQKDTGSPAIG